MKLLITLMGTAAFLMQMLTAGQATAQDNAGNIYGTDTVEAKFVGTVGGAVLGAEVVMVVQAAFGVDKVWPYIVFPLLGAGGGGVGGYFLEKKSTPGSVALLIAGIAFVIPSAIITSNAFAYNPEKEGAVERDDDSSLSFELPPESGVGASASEEQGAVTEVEAKPDVGPPGSAALPPPGGPMEAPEEEETAPPEENAPPDDAAPPNPEAPPAASPTTMRRRQHRRQPPLGSLLNVDADAGVSRFGFPAPQITPALVQDPNGMVLAKGGVQVMIPVLQIALP